MDESNKSAGIYFEEQWLYKFAFIKNIFLSNVTGDLWDTILSRKRISNILHFYQMIFDAIYCNEVKSLI